MRSNTLTRVSNNPGAVHRHVNQMLVSLGKAGLIYKNRFGKYLFAAPLMSQFVRRQAQQYTDQEE